MSGVSSQFMSFSSRILVPSLNWSTNFCRSYVRAFWAKNNDSPFIHGHKRNPPKMGNYVRGKRNILFRKEYYKPNEFKRMRRIGYDTLMKTPQGRLKIMKKYLERNPYLGEAM